MIVTALAAAALCTPGTVDRSPLETIQAFNAAYDARDVAAVAKILSADAVVRDGMGDTDGATVLHNYATRIFKADPPFVGRPLEMIVVGDLVAETMSFTGGGQEPVDVLTVYRVRGGCIVELNSNLSMPE